MATTDVRPAAPPAPAPATTREEWRGRLLPRTVLGMAVLIFAMGVAAGTSGAIFYSYYEYRLDKNEERTRDFVADFDERFKTAIDTITAERENAKAAIAAELEPLRQIRAEGETLEALLDKVKPSLYFVRTLDEAGAPSVGSAFVIASDSKQSLLLTSFNTVRAATRQPGPDVTVRQGDDEMKAQVWTWQEERDLALLIIPKGNQPKLAFTSDTINIGERVFVASGLGTAGGAISQGFVADVSAAGIQHNAAVGAAFQGGPLLNSDGEVLGIASRAYAPLGFTTDAVWFAVPGRAACERVLKCPNGTPAAVGERS